MVAKMQYLEICAHDSSSFFFKGVFSLPSIFNSCLTPCLPKHVADPTQHTTAFPPPDMIMVPVSKQLSGFSLWLSGSSYSSSSPAARTADGSFSTHLEFPYLVSSTVMFISSINRQSAGTISPYVTVMTSPTTRSLTRISLSVPYWPLNTVTLVLLISSLILRNYFSCPCSDHALMDVANTTPA